MTLLKNIMLKSRNAKFSIELMKVLKTEVCNSFRVSQERNLSTTTKKKQKIVVTRRSFPSKYKNKGLILQSKVASKVIKRLNWENKHLFGAVQSSKPAPRKIRKNSDSSDREKQILKSKEIIQHRTVIPIVDPHEIAKSDSLIKSDSEQASNVDLKTENLLNILLNFPLMNKPLVNKVDCSYNISEKNLLRQELEKLGRTHTPSVSLILQKTMSKKSAENLLKWKLNLINQLGEEGFQQHQAELFRNGSSIHECINNFLTEKSETDLPITEAIKGHWTSLKPVFPHITDVKLMEEHISHPFLNYKGVVDCFARYRNKLVVIDWKTSKKAKTTLGSTFDNPLQIAAYVGALNFDPKFQYLANKGLIVVAYEDGTPASAHFIDEAKMLQYWKEWLKRLKLYWEQTVENNLAL